MNIIKKTKIAISFFTITLLFLASTNNYVEARYIKTPVPINKDTELKSMSDSSAKLYATSQVIVKYKSSLGSNVNSNKQTINYSDVNILSMPKSLMETNKKYGLKSLSEIGGSETSAAVKNIYLLSYNSGDSKNIVADLKKYPEVQYATVNYKITFFNNSDPFFSEQWYLHNTNDDIDIDALEAYDLSGYGVEPVTNTTVSVLDQPLYVEHPDLKDSVWINSGETDNDGIDNDNNGYIDDYRGCFFGHVDTTYNCSAGGLTAINHGTKVSGVLAATHNNNEGIKGVCPNCKLMRAGVPYFFYNVFEAINYSVNNGAKVINMSWGFSGDVDSRALFQEVLDYAHSQGVVLVAATGNSSGTFENAPAKMNHVIAVTAINQNNVRASFATYGPNTDLSAPGGDIIYSTDFASYGWPREYSYYVRTSGTSFSSPMVAGAAGMIYSYKPDLTPNQIEQILKDTTDPIIYTNNNEIGKMGAGRLNVFRALYVALNLKDVHKDKTIVSAQCFEGKTRLEIRDSNTVKVNGSKAEHILDNVYSAWVSNGSHVNIEGSGWSTTLDMPQDCKLSIENNQF